MANERYEAIAFKARTEGLAVREMIFEAVEQDNMNKAVRLAERLRAIDSVFMLATQTGLRAIEAARKAAVAAAPEPKIEPPENAEELQAAAIAAVFNTPPVKPDASSETPTTPATVSEQN